MTDCNGLSYDYRGPVGVVVLSSTAADGVLHPVIAHGPGKGISKQQVFRARADQPISIPLDSVKDQAKAPVTSEEMRELDAVVSMLFLSSKKS